MTRHLISETSSTAESKPKNEATVATNTEPGPLDTRSGMLLAGLVLWAALTTAGPTGTAPMSINFRRRDEIAAESSTADVERDPELLKQVEGVFNQGASEFFQDGMFSHFSQSLL